MMAARGSCIEKRMAEVAYGCASHALNDLTSDAMKWREGHAKDCALGRFRGNCRDRKSESYSRRRELSLDPRGIYAS